MSMKYPLNEYINKAKERANENYMILLDKIKEDSSEEVYSELLGILNSDRFSSDDSLDFLDTLFAGTRKFERLGVVSLIFYRVAIGHMKANRLDECLLPLMYAVQYSQLYLKKEKINDSLKKMWKMSESNALRRATSQAGKASATKRYPWKKDAGEVARRIWREKDIFHNELADWLLEKYCVDGFYPFSGKLVGIREGNERRAMMNYLKEVAKDEEFSGRKLIKGS